MLLFSVTSFGKTAASVGSSHRRQPRTRTASRRCATGSASGRFGGNMNEGRVGPPAHAALLIVAAGACCGVEPAFAVGFSSEDGAIKGSWDTTLSYGLAWRMEDRDPSIIGT